MVTSVSFTFNGSLPASSGQSLFYNTAPLFLMSETQSPNSLQFLSSPKGGILPSSQIQWGGGGVGLVSPPLDPLLERPGRPLLGAERVLWMERFPAPYGPPPRCRHFSPAVLYEMIKAVNLPSSRSTRRSDIFLFFLSIIFPRADFPFNTCFPFSPFPREAMFLRCVYGIRRYI